METGFFTSNYDLGYDVFSQFRVRFLREHRVASAFALSFAGSETSFEDPN